jgi:enamine deaminase RidA (YjgF/YER057c/UK114 family)
MKTQLHFAAMNVLFCTLLAGCAGGVRTTPDSAIIIPTGREPAYDSYHYAPAVRVGEMVVVSGIPAARGDTYEARIRWMFDRLKLTLEAAGASIDDVIEINTFHREPKDTAAFNEEFKRFLVVHEEYFHGNYPAWTAVGTTALLADDAPVEMRAVAVIGYGKHRRVLRGKPAAN